MTSDPAGDHSDLGWRYVASRSAGDILGEDVSEIRELYPTNGGGFGYTAGPISAAGATLDELRRDLVDMLADTFRPSLDLTAETPALDGPVRDAHTPASALPEAIRDLLAFLHEQSEA